MILETLYGHLIRQLHSCTDQAMTNALASMDLTAAQGHIMGFISHQDGPPCPRDIEEELHLSHPTVSGLLSRLEKKGFIQTRTDEADHRCKRIYILPKGQELNDTMAQIMLGTEAQMVVGFTDGEKAQFRGYLLRAIGNMRGPGKDNHKEESTQC